jgi:hypothetical protein
LQHLPSVEEIRAAAVERAELSARSKREAEQAKREAAARADAVGRARASHNFRLGQEFLDRAGHFDLPETAYIFRVTAREREGPSYDARLTLIPADVSGASFRWELQERRLKTYSRPPNRYQEDPGETKVFTTYSEPKVYPASGLVAVEPEELARKMTSRLMTTATLRKA